MPTYDYQRRSCGSVTEVIHSMLEDGPTVCERCGGDLRRVLYPTGIIFKGSGFYRTDSRAPTASGSSDSSGTSSGEGGKASSAGDKGPAKPKESTPATGSGSGSPSAD